MNFLSINIRGIGSRGKPSWINKLKNDFGVAFIGLQETMSSDIPVRLIDSYWGGQGYDFEKVDSEGNSGGLLSLWDPKFFSKDKVVKDKNFLLVSGVLADGNNRLNIINVYAPQNNSAKRDLWNKLCAEIVSAQGWWIVFGPKFQLLIKCVPMTLTSFWTKLGFGNMILKV